MTDKTRTEAKTEFKKEAKTNAALSDNEHRRLLQDKIRRTQHKMLDVLEGVVDAVTPKPEPPLARVAERRQIANILGAWQFCARRGCRRARCCLGEPRECLRVTMPLLEGTAFAGLVKKSKRRARA